MSDNQQPFSPPLTAEERDAWDLVYMGCCVQNTVESSAKHADEAIHERRRRFGVPTGSQRGKGGLEELHEGKIDCALCGEKLKPDHYVINRPQQGGLRHFDCEDPECGGPVLGEKPPTVPVEVDVLRAEVETLKEQHREDLLRAEQAEVSRDHFRRAYHIRNEVIEAVRKAFHDNLGFRNAETRMAFYQVKDVWDALEQLDAYMRGASAADPVDELRAEVDRLTKGRDDLRVLLNSAREQTNAQPGERLEHAIQVIIDRAEKAEAELAAASPVLEAAVKLVSLSVLDKEAIETLEIVQTYADAQRAARAAKAQDATNNVDGGN